jgi:hypothetical protein
MYDSYYSRYGVTDEIIRSAIQNINDRTKTLNKFRELYYALKFKKQLRDWLWFRVREPVLKNKYHPNYLSDLHLCTFKTPIIDAKKIKNNNFLCLLFFYNFYRFYYIFIVLS